MTRMIHGQARITRETKQTHRKPSLARFSIRYSQLADHALLVIGLFLACIVTSAQAEIRQAQYRVIGAGEGSSRLVVDLRITSLGETADGYADWQMDAAFEEGKKVVSIRAASDRVPMTSNDGCGAFHRYVYRVPGGETFDYRHARSDMAVLPVIGFRELLLPTPESEAVMIDGFAGAGQFLAQVILLDRVVTPDDFRPIEGGQVLRLDPDLLIGTSRNFKDDGTGRPSPTANYTFVPLEGPDYEKLIAAGHNYFGVKAEQLQWVQGKPVFYRGPATYPDDCYRANYVPGPMFSDEPMVRLGWQGAAPEELDHPQQMASFLKSRVEHIYQSISSGTELYQYLARSGNPPSVNLRDYNIAPTWETEYQAAFYELAGGAPGIVHEGRYVMDGYGWHPDAVFGPGLEVTPREMLLCYYGFLRGAARAFDGDWGTSIYGQSDPTLRAEAMTLAYDLGAKYIWFWTSDHDHHMEFPEQLKLGRALTDHAKAHPRGDLESLKRTAKVGIVFPRGYTLGWGHMWGQRCFSPESRNRTDTAYREVSAAALWQGVMCAKQGVPFDFTVDHEGIEKLGYEQLLFIGEDAGVRPVPVRMKADPVRLDIGLDADAPTDMAAVDAPPGSLTAVAMHAEPPAIDGDLGDWRHARWLAQRDRPSGEGQWDGTGDLAMKVAFAYDERNLYVAAEVTDDVHSQPYYGWDLWKGDGIQIGFDPLNEENVLGYSGNQSEIALVKLDSGRSIAWRYHCRRGQRPREMTDVKVAVKRERNRTRYEAAIPLSELTPLAPEVTTTVGVGVTVNDADAEPREVCHETSPGSMTSGKNPRLFRKLVFTPFHERPAVRGPRSWATIVWDRLAVPCGGAVTFDLSTRSWDARDLVIDARLEPRSPLQALATSATLPIESDDKPQQRRVKVAMNVPAGRYDLAITVRERGEATIAEEHMTVFVYPPAEDRPGEE